MSIHANQDQLNALANVLTNEAIKSLQGGLNLKSTLDPSDPDSVEAFEKLKGILMAAYWRGVKDRHFGSVVLATSDISQLKRMYDGDVEPIFLNANIRFVLPRPEQKCPC